MLAELLVRRSGISFDATEQEIMARFESQWRTAPTCQDRCVILKTLILHPMLMHKTRNKTILLSPSDACDYAEVSSSPHFFIVDLIILGHSVLFEQYLPKDVSLYEDMG